MKKILKKYAVLIVFVAIVLLIAIAYLAGFRVGPGISINRVGTLTVTNLPSGASVFIDQSLRGTASKTGVVRSELVAGTHTVIVSVSGDYPWSSTVSIASGKAVTADPILISEVPKGFPLTGAEKTVALAAIASTTLPVQNMPLELAGGCALIYVQNNQIIEDPATSTPSCTPPPYLCVNGSCASTIIYSPVAPLDAVLPYPGRQDAVLILLDHSLFVLGLDSRNTQYFAPIAHGTKPAVGTLPDGTVVVSDAGAVSKLSL